MQEDLLRISLTAMALGPGAVNQEGGIINTCMHEVIADGMTNAEAVRFSNRG